MPRDSGSDGAWRGKFTLHWFGLHIYRYNYMHRHMYRYMVKYIYRYIDTRMRKYKYKFTYTYEQVPWDTGSNGAWRGKSTLAVVPASHLQVQVHVQAYVQVLVQVHVQVRAPHLRTTF